MLIWTSFSNDTVTHTVGVDRVEFTVHLKQLEKSPFFRSAVKKDWLVDGTIALPIDDPTVVHCYLHFLYSSAVPANFYEALAELYVFGEKIMDVDFKNAVIGAIIRETRKPETDGHCYFPTGDVVDILYAGTSSGSPARKLMVDLFFYHGSPSWFDGHEYNGEFLNDVVMKRMEENLKIGGRSRAVLQEEYLEGVK